MSRRDPQQNVLDTDGTVLGQYTQAGLAGLVATQALNSWISSFRWTNTTSLCVIQSIKAQFLQTAAATATITPLFVFLIARNFTVADSAGSAITPTGNTAKDRTNMPTSALNDRRMSAAAAGLTAGTRTTDATAFMWLPTIATITVPNTQLYTVEYRADDERYPIVLAANEGIVVQMQGAGFGAAGSAFYFETIQWAEVAAY